MRYYREFYLDLLRGARPHPRRKRCSKRLNLAVDVYVLFAAISFSVFFRPAVPAATAGLFEKSEIFFAVCGVCLFCLAPRGVAGEPARTKSGDGSGFRP